MFEQTDSRRLGFAMDDQFYASPPFLEGIRKALPGLTPETVNAAVRKHLDPSRLRFVFVTDKGEALKQELLSGKPTPIKYASPKDAKVMEADRKIEAFPLQLKPEEIQVLKAIEPFAK